MAMNPHLPLQVGNYLMKGVIGGGGQGIVALAQEKRTGKQVAIKFLRPDMNENEMYRVRFAIEIEALRRMKGHPHLVKFIEAGEISGQPYYVMEYLPHGTLKQRIVAGPVSPRRAAKIALTLARTVADIHAKGILVRDISPTNVLRKGRTFKIADLGLAKLMDNLDSPTELYAPIGNYNMMPPEFAISGTRYASPAGDVFQIGVILASLLLGHSPFRQTRTTPEEVRDQELLLPITAYIDVPLSLLAVLKKALAWKASERYATAAELALDLRRWLQDKATTAEPRLSRVFQVLRQISLTLLV